MLIQMLQIAQVEYGVCLTRVHLSGWGFPATQAMNSDRESLLIEGLHESYFGHRWSVSIYWLYQMTIRFGRRVIAIMKISSPSIWEPF